LTKDTKDKGDKQMRVLRKFLQLCTLPFVLLAVATTVAQMSGVGVAPAWADDDDDRGPIANGGYGGIAPIPEPTIPAGVDVYNLTLDQTRLYSRSHNFEVLGHSYFKGPWQTASAQAAGLGSSFNTPRVYNGIFYGGGYNSPAILFGVLIADVHNPRNMQPLSFIPCNTGTRCPYIRLDRGRMILVGTQDTTSSNPSEPPAGTAAQAGVNFYDVSNPRAPKLLSFVATRPNGLTHGLDLDNNGYAYACAETTLSKTNVGSNHEVVIVDYRNPTAAQIVGTFHIQGQHIGETFAAQDQLNPDGTAQKVWCHEIFYSQNRLYVAYRDAGMVILDVTDRTNPKQILRYDWVPPYNGGSLGAAHSVVPLLPNPAQQPTLAITTDENFSCPSGFGRVFDISNPTSPQILSTYRVPFTQDNYDFTTDTWICPSGQQTVHYPWFDFRSSSLLYQAWYSQGERVFDLTNPYEPKEIGYYLSPPYSSGAGSSLNLRQTREEWQDPDTGLIYLTDGNGGGLTVLRWRGPVPANHQVPGAR
jgi:hypothetical protein